jgi:NADH:ubiquinone oxidoreductase subunit E
MDTKTKIIICQGSSCFSRGNRKNLQVILRFLNEYNLESEVNFKGQLCSANCMQGPIIYINDVLYEQVDEEKVIELLKKQFNIK